MAKQPPSPKLPHGKSKSKSTKKVRPKEGKGTPVQLDDEMNSEEEVASVQPPAPKAKPKSRINLINKPNPSKQAKPKVAAKVPAVVDTEESLDEQEEEEEDTSASSPTVVRKSSNAKSRAKEKTNPKQVKQAKSKERFKKSTKTAKTNKPKQQQGSKSSHDGSSASSLTKPDEGSNEMESTGRSAGGSCSTSSKSIARPASKVRPKSKAQKIGNTKQQQSSTKRAKSQRPKSRAKSKGQIVCKGRSKSKERMHSKEKSKSGRPKQSACKVPGKARGKVCGTSASKRSTTSVSQTTANLNSSQKSNQSTHIIFVGNSEKDAKALDLLKSLYEQISKSKGGNAATSVIVTTTNEDKQPQQKDQMSKDAPIPAEPVITDQTKLEELYDEMLELTNNVNTLKDSYDKIVQSLVNLQKRRPKASTKSLMPQQKQSPATVTASTQGKQPQPKTTTAPPTAPPPTKVVNPLLDRFMNPDTRDESFTQLFAAIEKLKTTMQPFLKCFDENGYISMEAYNRAPILVSDRDAWLGEIRSLSPTVAALLRQYSEELLDMFRLSSSVPSTTP